MKTIFDQQAREALIDRIHRLDENAEAQWGKMNLPQMLKHCIFWDEWVQGKNKQTYKQEWLGMLFGKLALHSMIKDDKPFKQNIPAGSKFTFTEATEDVDTQKQKWAALVADYAHFSNPGFIHDFFGKMSREQIGILAFKHADRHLRQFGG